MESTLTGISVGKLKRLAPDFSPRGEIEESGRDVAEVFCLADLEEHDDLELEGIEFPFEESEKCVKLIYK